MTLAPRVPTRVEVEDNSLRFLPEENLLDEQQQAMNAMNSSHKKIEMLSQRADFETFSDISYLIDSQIAF